MEDLSITMVTPEGEPTVTVLCVSGAMTIQYAGELKNALLHALENYEQIRLDVGKVSAVDLSGLQLICSAHRTSIQLNKQFAFNGAGSEVLKSVGSEAGFPRHVGCSQDKGHTCIWVGGEC